MPQQISKNKIMLVINHMDWFWSHRLPLAKAMQEKGWDVLVCASNATNDENLKEQGFYPHNITQISGVTSLFTMMRDLKSILKAEQPDVVHAITLKYAFPTGLAAHSYKGKVVHTIAGLGYLFAGDGLKPKLLRAFVTPFFKRAFLGKNTKLIFQNPDDMALMMKRGFAIEESSTLIRGSGVDLEKFKPFERPQNTKPKVLFPTRLVWEKGIKVFIEATKILDQKGVEAEYLLAGGIKNNTPNAITQAEMKAVLEGSSVNWLGHVSDMPALLQEVDIIAYPSWYGEGVPKVLLEAAACALPIITTDHPGCREVVEVERNGYLVPVKDAESLAQKLEELLQSPELAQRMGEESRKIVAKHFSIEQVVSETIKVYET